MALSAATLKADLKPELEAKIRSALSLGATPYVQLTNFCDGLAEAIANKVVAHIVSNAALNNAQFSGTFPGTTTGSTCSTTITNQPVTGGII